MLAALRPGSLRVLSTQTSVTDGFINRARQVIQWCPEHVESVIDHGEQAWAHRQQQPTQDRQHQRQATPVTPQPAPAEKVRTQPVHKRLAWGSPKPAGTGSSPTLRS